MISSDLCPTLALAPMQGISDPIVRELFTGLRGIDLAFTDFLRITEQPLQPHVLEKHYPECRTGGRTIHGTPVMLQLLGSSPPHLARAAKLACEMGAYGIDINFGCPARRVNGHGGGAALLRSPGHLTEILRTVRDVCPPHVPVSAKVRLGWSDPDEIFEIAAAIEAGNPSWMTIHGRTRAAMYAPPADWTRIGLLARSMALPLFANGDVFNPAGLQQCMTVTGTSRVMLGRGPFQLPNLFRLAKGLDTEPMSTGETVELLRRFQQRVEHSQRYREPVHAAAQRLKSWLRNLAAQSTFFCDGFHETKVMQTGDQILGRLEHKLKAC